MTFFGSLSIRLRITIGSTLIAALIVAAAGFAFRAAVESILASTTLTLLKHDVAPAVEEIQNDPSGPINAPGRGQYIVILDPKGTEVQNTLPRNLAGRLPTLLKVGDEVEIVQGHVESFSVLNKTVHASNGDWTVIAVRDQDPAIIALDRIGTALVVGGALAVAGMGATAWLLTGASLRPITRLRKQAEARVASGSAEPLAIGGAVDEVSALATTLNELIAELRRSVERERRLVSDASHELRTPLSVLLTQLELAHLHSGDAEALEAELNAAQASARELAALANSLLELYELESPRKATSSTFAELGAELAKVIDRVRSMVASRPITVDFEVGNDVDAALALAIGVFPFARVVENLVVNAVNAIDGAGSVVVALTVGDAGLELSVRDNGPGMPESFIPRAFDRFTRPDEARQRASGGSGLGLSIVWAIVSASGGTITLENDGGLVATVRIPRVL